MAHSNCLKNHILHALWQSLWSRSGIKKKYELYSLSQEKKHISNWPRKPHYFIQITRFFQVNFFSANARFFQVPNIASMYYFSKLRLCLTFRECEIHHKEAMLFPIPHRFTLSTVSKLFFFLNLDLHNPRSPLKSLIVHHANSYG